MRTLYATRFVVPTTLYSLQFIAYVGIRATSVPVLDARQEPPGVEFPVTAYATDANCVNPACPNATCVTLEDSSGMVRTISYASAG